MRVIEVVAAIIYKDGAYFATQRGYANLKGCGSFLVVRLNLAKLPKVLLNAKYMRNLE